MDQDHYPFDSDGDDEDPIDAAFGGEPDEPYDDEPDEPYDPYNDEPDDEPYDPYDETEPDSDDETDDPHNETEPDTDDETDEPSAPDGFEEEAEEEEGGGLPLVSPYLSDEEPEAEDEEPEAEDEEPDEEPEAEDEESDEEPEAEDEESDEEPLTDEEPEAEDEEPLTDEEPEAEEAEEEEPEAEEKDDQRAISSDLIRGHINTIILRALYDGDKYGYEIIAEIERKSHGQYTLKQPSLYSALKRLEKEGYITSYWGGSVSGGRRKYFSLTDNGKAIAERNLTEWEYSRTVIDSLISDKAFDFSQPAPAAVDMRVLKRSTSRVPEREGEEDDETTADGYDPLAADRAAFDAERARYEESLRVREEVLRAREEAGTKREQELLEREFALAAEEERRQVALEEEEARRQEEEQLRREDEARQAEETRRREEEQLRLEEEARQKEEARRREEEQLRLEEEARQKEEARRREEEQFRLEEEARQAEEARRREEEQLRREEEARQEEEARRREEEQLRYEEEMRREEEERARYEEELRRQEEEERRRQAGETLFAPSEIDRSKATELTREKEEQNSRIREMEPFAEERARYEQRLREQEAEFLAMHERELAEQEARIREEDERLYRHREQQIIHQNYLDLVNGGSGAEPAEGGSYYYEEPAQPDYVYVAKPEEEREYRSIIRRLYNGAVPQEEPPAPAPEPAAAEPVPPAPVAAAPAAPKTPAPAPAPSPAPKAAEEKPKVYTGRSLDGVDFYDLESLAAQDGIRITTSGDTPKKIEEKSESLVHRGKALFLSALVVFLLCLAEGSIALGFQSQLKLPRFYPYFIWGTGLALLMVTFLMYLNRFGERSLRKADNLLAEVIVSYALCIIVILIVALAAKVDFTDMGQLMTYVILPAVYFFSIVVFGVAYYLQVRPLDE